MHRPAEPLHFVHFAVSGYLGALDFDLQLTGRSPQAKLLKPSPTSRWAQLVPEASAALQPEDHTTFLHLIRSLHPTRRPSKHDRRRPLHTRIHQPVRSAASDGLTFRTLHVGNSACENPKRRTQKRGIPKSRPKRTSRINLTASHGSWSRTRPPRAAAPARPPPAERLADAKTLHGTLTKVSLPIPVPSRALSGRGGQPKN